MRVSVGATGLATVVLLAVGLAGCDSKDSVTAKNESAEVVAAKVAKTAVRPLPGRWESVMTVDRMEVKGMPPEAAQAVQGQLGGHTFFTCLTPAEAEKPQADFFRPGASGCTYDSFTMADGKVDAVMSCKADGAGAMKNTMTGTYGESEYAMRITSEGEMQPGMPMSMAMTITSRRVGDCKGDEEK